MKMQQRSYVRIALWKDVHPAFTFNLWHSRCMKKYCTLTAHWIGIGGTPLAPCWELQHQMLGLYAVQDVTIDHQGACALCMPVSAAEFPLSLGPCLIVVLLCTYYSCYGATPLFNLHVDFPGIVTDCRSIVAKAFNTIFQWE